jgi:hypothetical protein
MVVVVASDWLIVSMDKRNSPEVFLLVSAAPIFVLCHRLLNLFTFHAAPPEAGWYDNDHNYGWAGLDRQMKVRIAAVDNEFKIGTGSWHKHLYIL